jgi:SWI/SNF-related matrix-associated actin-dependent regulator 1 of chromatin subfamily A
VIAKWPGKCADCGRKITPGDTINWDRETRTTTHEDCNVAAPAVVAQAAAAVVESRALDVPPDFRPPLAPGFEYLPFQRAGIHYALQRFATLIADDPGLGKTIQAVGVINSIESIKRVLVICPTSVALNWKKELERFLVRPMDVAVLADSKKWPVGADVVIVTWGRAATVRTTIDAHLWDLVIVDESHYGKDATKARTRAVFGYEGSGRGAERVPPDPGIRGNRRIALTGTPIENSPRDIFPTLRWLDPETWPKFWDFGLAYCDGKRVKIGWDKFRQAPRMVWDFSGVSNLADLQAKLRAKVMVRRLKPDVLSDLPPKRRQIIVIDADKMTRAAAAAQLEMWSLRAPAIDLMEARATSSDPKHYALAAKQLEAAKAVVFNAMSRETRELAVRKAPFVVEHVIDLLEVGPGKILLGVHHKEVVDIMLRDLDAFKPACITGATKDRDAQVARFQTEPECRVMVAEITSVIGLTMTAATTVVCAEFDWRPGVMKQFEDRAHRIGQTESILVQHIVVDGSLDSQKIVTLLEKQDMVNDALDTRA